mmetsp:Transcript_33669/g.71850  ORF Transcript_33669/g.71850 Transcript_33669/m.71850 type:complete len:283 (+) Transcript_33669:154-1002(+)
MLTGDDRANHHPSPLAGSKVTPSASGRSRHDINRIKQLQPGREGRVLGSLAAGGMLTRTTVGVCRTGGRGSPSCFLKLMRASIDRCDHGDLLLALNPEPCRPVGYPLDTFSSRRGLTRRRQVGIPVTHLHRSGSTKGIDFGSRWGLLPGLLLRFGEHLLRRIYLPGLGATKRVRPRRGSTAATRRRVGCGRAFREVKTRPFAHWRGTASGSVAAPKSAVGTTSISTAITETGTVPVTYVATPPSTTSSGGGITGRTATVKAAAGIHLLVSDLGCVQAAGIES